MSEFKEFQGKNLDEAIGNACDYFNLDRNKLEIEILSGGSTGVFGLVGKKNAKVKARPRKGAENPPKNETVNQPKEQVVETTRTEVVEEIIEEKIEVKAEVETSVEEDVQEEVAEKSDEIEARSHEEEPVIRRSIMEGDPEDIAAAVREALEMMIEPIIQEKPNLEIEVGEDRVNVLIDDEENSGLIIGREGQTLAALQYLSNRMVSKKLQTSVRVQIDTGDYRERQDEKLRQLAWHLADKALHTGRAQSTKPLSSYHRRVVHMALQEDKHVNTRSKGDGPMKRVLILPRRGRNNSNRDGGYNNQRSGGYNNKSNNRKPYNNDRNNRNNRNDRPERSDRNPRNDRPNYGSRPNNDRNSYGNRRNDNYRPRRNNNDNYGSRGRSYDDNSGNRYQPEGYGNRYPNDTYGNRKPENYGNRKNYNEDQESDGPDKFNSEKYNRY